MGDAFTIEGVTYTPTDKLNFDTVGYASTGIEGGNGVSIAHKTLPLPSYAEVTALDSGKTILVRVERRGPMNNEHIVELSPGAAEQLGHAGSDKMAIRIRRVNPPEVERAMLRAGNRAPNRMDTPQSLLAVLRRKLEPQPAPRAAASPAPDTAGLTTPKLTAPPVAPSVPKTTPSPATPAVIRPAQAPGASPAVRAAPAPKTSPAARSTPAPTPAPVASTTPAPVTGGFVVQVATFSVERNASQTATKLGARSVPAGRTWRVRMGPFANRGQAAAALAKARAAGFRDARIERAD
ncbi:MAG: SPOR domain-containing protein [Novosphingobium sp.]